jgi:hypothetical protein
MPKKLIHTEDQAIQNIISYTNIASQLADRMPFARAWYGVKQNGQWCFGPSKFVGYSDLTAQSYLNLSATNLDGRITESVLDEWFTRVPDGDFLLLELLAAIKKFFARYGKRPNQKLRILVQKSLFEKKEVLDELPRLLATVVRRLSPKERQIFQEALNA